MMVAYNFLDTYLPTGYCRIVKPRKSKPTFPLHSSFASRVWAYRVLASFSSHPMPFSHSWIVSLHRWMPSHVLWNTTLLLRHTRKAAFPRAKQRTTVHNKFHDTPRPTYPRRCSCRLRAGRRSHAGPGGEVDCPPPQPPGTG